MNESRDFAAEYLAACIDSRRPDATLRDRDAAWTRQERILEAADRAGVDLYSQCLAIDEAARLTLYPAN